MLVRETLDACECEDCGISCTGRFANCWRSIFQVNGRALQLRCLPPSISQVAETASSEKLVENTEPLTAGSPALAAAGTAGTDIEEYAGLREPGTRSDQDLTELQHRVAEISDRIQTLSCENSEIRIALAAIADQLEALQSPLRPVTPIIRPRSNLEESFTRPGRAVAHPDVVHRQYRAESRQSTENGFVAHPLAGGSGGTTS